MLLWLLLIAVNSGGGASQGRVEEQLLRALASVLPPGPLYDVLADLAASALHLLRKPAHFAQYGIFAALLLRAVRLTSGWRDWQAAGAAVAVTAVVAGLDELHQASVPERTGSLRDIAVDVGGAIAGVLLSLWWGRRQRPGRSRPGGAITRRAPNR